MSSPGPFRFNSCSRRSRWNHRPATCRSICEPLDRRVLMAAGDPDLGFGGNGHTTISFAGAPFDARAVALRSDGKTILAGTKGGRLALVRLNVNGSLDTTFGGGGLFESAVMTRANDVAVQGDNMIVVVGLEPRVGGGPDPNRFTTARILPDGEGLDSGFDGDGIVSRRYGTDSLGGYCYANALAIQEDGKIVVGGQAYIDDLFSPGHDFVIARYNADGSPDNTFGTRPQGVPLTWNWAGMGGRDEILDLAIDYNGTPSTNPLYGSIIAVGNTDAYWASNWIPQGSQFAVARFRPNGTLDGDFDGDGKLTTSFFAADSAWANGVIALPGGQVIVTGSAHNTARDEHDLALIRYNANGSIDTTFGPAAMQGKVQRHLYADDVASDSARSYMGGFLVAASTGVAAFTADGLLDNRFSEDGAIPVDARAGVVTTGSAIAPVRKVVTAGGNQAQRYIDVGPRAALLAGITETHEASGPTLNIIVGLDRMPTDQRVYIDFAGTATRPFFTNPLQWDYTTTGISGGTFNDERTYVTIPAGQTFTTFTITPINDARPEGDETIELRVSPEPSYDIGNPSNYTLLIRDDDLVAPPAVAESKFEFEAAPQRVTFRFNQNVASSIGADDFAVTGPTGNVAFNFAYDASLNAATLSFPTRLDDGDYAARAMAAGITNANGQPMAADHVIDFFFMNGDANRDRRVNLADFNVLASNFGQSNRTFSDGDFNYDAVVNLQDFNILAARFGQSIAPAAAAGPGVGATGGTGADDEAEDLLV